MEAPGAHKGVEFQSWEATVERKRTKAAVGEVGGWAAPAKIAAHVTSMAKLGMVFFGFKGFTWKVRREDRSNAEFQYIFA